MSEQNELKAPLGEALKVGDYVSCFVSGKWIYSYIYDLYETTYFGSGFFAIGGRFHFEAEGVTWFRGLHPSLIPSGYVLMPESLTAENGAKQALHGEFVQEDSEFVSWTNIKDIYQAAVKLLGVKGAGDL